MPQVAEIDAYNTTTGKQEDDVNTIVEWVRVALGFDNTADDEDDDSGQNTQLVTVFVCECPKTISVFDIVSKNYTILTKNLHYPSFCSNKINNPCFDVIAPPPKA